MWTKLWCPKHLTHRERRTVQQLLEAGPHDVDVLYPQELELDVCIMVVILVAFTSSLIGHGINLKQQYQDVCVMVEMVIRIF